MGLGFKKKNTPDDFGFGEKAAQNDERLVNETRIDCLHFNAQFGPPKLIESSETRGAPSAEPRFAINNFTR